MILVVKMNALDVIFRFMGAATIQIMFAFMKMHEIIKTTAVYYHELFISHIKLLFAIEGNP